MKRLLPILFLLGLLSFSAHAADKASIELAIAETWLLNIQQHQNLTPWERSLIAAGIIPQRFVWKTDTEGNEYLQVSFGDEFSSGLIARINVWPAKSVERNSRIRFYSDSSIKEEKDFDLRFNHVDIHPRSSGENVIRDVYLGDTNDAETIEDRLRLAVNDITILNPWLRGDRADLKEQLGLKHLPPFRSKPQKDLLEFLIHLNGIKGELSKGTLLQMNTGMGKTKVIEDYLEHLVDTKQPFRTLWLTNGLELIDESYGRLKSNLPGKSFVYHSSNQANRREFQDLANGGSAHIFGSMDSFTAQHERQRQILRRWIHSSTVPIVLVMDESHSLGNEVYYEFYQWLWAEAEAQFQARIALTATPFHHRAGAITKFFRHVKYALVEPGNLDPETLLPRMNFLTQIIMAASKGYVPVPIFYQLSHEVSTNRGGESVYSPEELESIASLIEAFMPGKMIAYHKSGTSTEFGGTSRAKQFHRYWDEHYRESTGMPSFQISYELEGTVRKGALDGFRASKGGILEATRMAGQGLNMEDVDAIGLFDEPESMALVQQRIGRGLRLSAGTPVTRIIDYTGANMAFLLKDLSALFSEKSFSEKKNRVIGILSRVSWDKNDPIPPDVVEELYQVLAIDPSVIKADSDALRRFLQITLQATRSVDYTVRDASAQTSSQKLPQPNDDQSLNSYLKSNLDIIAQRAGYESLDAAIRSDDFTVTKAVQVCNDDIEADSASFFNGLKFLIAEFRKEAGVSKKVVVEFEVRPEAEQTSPHKFPEPSHKQKLYAYVREHFVIAAKRAGFSDLETALKSDRFKTALILEVIAGDVSLKEGSIDSVIASILSTSRRDVGATVRQEIHFQIKADSEQKSIHKLPQRQPGQSIRNYMIENLEILSKRAGYSSLKEALDKRGFSTVAWEHAKEDVVVDEDPLRGAIRAAVVHFKAQLGLDVQAKIEFSVKADDQQESEHKLTQPLEGEAIGPYIARSHIVIAKRAGFDDLKTALASDDYNTARCFELVKDDLLVDEDTLKEYLRRSLPDLKKEHGIQVSVNIEFSVAIESKQVSEIKLPQPLDGESLRAYCNRNMEVFVKRVGFNDLAIALKSKDLSVPKMIQETTSDIDVDVNSLKNALSMAISTLRTTMGLDAPMKAIKFSVLPELEQMHEVKLPQRVEGQKIADYFALALIALAKRAGFESLDAALDSDEFSAAVAIELAQDDFIVEQGSLSAPITQSFNVARSAANSRRAQTKDFRVLPEGIQKDVYKLPAKLEDETLRDYLARNMRTLYRRGKFVDAADAVNKKKFGAVAFMSLCKGDIDVDQESLRQAFLAIQADIRNSIKAGKSEEGPKDQVAQRQAPAEPGTWPTSSILNPEIARINFLHRTVHRFVKDALGNDGNAVIYFLGRDADDFLATSKVLAANEGLSTDGLRRLNLSRSLLAPYPASSEIISKLSLDDLAKLMAHQGFSFDELRNGKKVYIFDIGFDGHVMRPILASILSTSFQGRPADFFDQVKPAFLFSQPERQSLVKGLSPSLNSREYIFERQIRLETLIRENQEAFLSAYKQNPELAIKTHYAAYGKFVIPEIRSSLYWSEMIDDRMYTDREIEAMWQDQKTKQSILKDPLAFRDWIESFIEGKGFHVVSAENSQEQQKLRNDLARSTGRIRKVSVDVNGNLDISYETSHTRESAINPHSELARQSHLCKLLFPR